MLYYWKIYHWKTMHQDALHCLVICLFKQYFFILFILKENRNCKIMSLFIKLNKKAHQSNLYFQKKSFSSWLKQVFANQRPLRQHVRQYEILIYQVLGKMSVMQLSLRGNRYSGLPELRQALHEIIADFNETWYRNVFSEWIHRHQRCIQWQGDFIEKL